MIKKIRVRLIAVIIGILERIFEIKVYLFYKKMFKNENLVIVDVGANRGQTINFFHKLNKKNFLYSFEPNPSLFKILKKKYKDNKNVKLFQKGVSDKSNTKTFYQNILHESSTFEKLNMSSKYLKMKSMILGVKPSEIIGKSYPIKVISLNKFLNKEGITNIDILKLDVEGHEYNCLKGFFSTNNPSKVKVIQFEHHEDDMYLRANNFDKINDLLNSHGYFIKKRIKHTFGDFYDFFYTQSNIS